MKYIEEYLKSVTKVKPLGELTTKDDELNGMSGEMVYIDGKCSDIFISHADYANWLEKQSEEARNDSQIWQIANNSAKTWEQSFAILNAAQKAYNKGKKGALKEQKPEHPYCQEHCKGYKESGGKCYFGFDCEAKREAEKKPIWREEDEEITSMLIELVESKEESMEVKIELIDWLKSIKDRVQSQNIVYYNPYKATIESIAEMCKRYDVASHSGLRDFYADVKVKCKEAIEYDKKYPQKQWKPTQEQLDALKWQLENTNESAWQYKATEELYNQLKEL